MSAPIDNRAPGSFHSLAEELLRDAFPQLEAAKIAEQSAAAVEAVVQAGGHARMPAGAGGETPAEYRVILGSAVVAAAGLAVPGTFAPVLDLAGVGTTWATMISAIAVRSGHPLDGATVGRLWRAAAQAVGGYLVGSKILTWSAAPLILAFPYAGVPAAVAANATLNGIFTLRLGLTCIDYFTRPGFRAADALNLQNEMSRRLVGRPTLSEIRTVRNLIRPAA